MHPILFTIPLLGGLPVHTYGVFVALGFLAGLWWVRREAARVGENPDLAGDLVFYIIVAGILGSRIAFYLFTDPAAFRADPLSFFRLWEGGLGFHGGFLLATAVIIWFLRKHHRSFWIYSDILSPGLALGHALGRIGCLMVGCCHGLPVPPAEAGAWWAITFPSAAHGVAPYGVALYPTQPAEAFANFCIFLVCAWWTRRKKFDGEVMALYFFLYGTVRFVLEFYRGESTRDFTFGHTFSVAQWISIGLWITAGAVFLARRGKGR